MKKIALFMMSSLLFMQQQALSLRPIGAFKLAPPFLMLQKIKENPGASDNVDILILIADYDNSTGKKDTPLDQTPDNMKWFYSNLCNDNTYIIVPTGRDEPRITVNLIDPLRKKISSENKHKLSHLFVITMSGAGIIGFDMEKNRVEHKAPPYMNIEDINKITGIIIDEVFDELDSMNLPSHLASQVPRCKEFALAELDRMKTTEEWLCANRDNRPAAQLRIIPGDLRDQKSGFGDIFIWNRGGMLAFELDYVNEALGIGQKTSAIEPRIKAKIGPQTSDGKALFTRSGLTHIDVALFIKGPTVRSVIENFILKKPEVKDKNIVVVSYGDSSSDLDNFELDFEKLRHIKVFLGKKEDEIERAMRIEDMVISADKLYEGAKKVLEVLATAHGQSFQILLEKLVALGSQTTIDLNALNNNAFPVSELQSVPDDLIGSSS